jgi:ethanolaminephosphotransferase
MCIYPLPQETLENMKRFQYKSTDESCTYNKCMSPCLNKVVNYLPTWLAPNLITLLSLCFNIFAAIISFLDGGFDFSFKLKSSTCFIIGLFQLIYQLLDNIDGKQARRTGNSTPFGMLMDHGCDIFTNIFTCFNLSKLLLVGNDNIYSFSVFLGLILGFYMMTYEEYKLGEMHFPVINGTDEGNLFVALLGILLSIFGQDCMTMKINEDYSITVGQLIGLGVIIAGSSCVFNLYLHTYQQKGVKEAATNFLDNIPFYSVIFVPIIYIEFDLDFYKDYKWIILTNASLIFARITLDIQVKILTLDYLTCNIFYFFTNIAFIISLFIHVNFFKLFFLTLLLIVQMTELSFFIYQRAKEITDFLEIRIFCVNNQSIQI